MSIPRRLCDALVASAQASGAAIGIVGCESVAWASGLYDGERHEIAVTGVPSDALEAWIAALPGIDLPLGRRIVDDILVIDRGADRVLRIEALTIVVAD